MADKPEPDQATLRAAWEANAAWYRANVSSLVAGKWYCISDGGVFDGPCDWEEQLCDHAYESQHYPSPGALVVCAGARNALEPIRM